MLHRDQQSNPGGVRRIPMRKALLMRCLACGLIAFVLFQPLLCLIHCQLHAAPREMITRSLPNDPLQFFLCDLPVVSNGGSSFILAFWPGLPLQIAIFSLHLLIWRLRLASAQWPKSYQATPPIPPPRRALPNFA